jgi:hypothetical protein
MVVEHPVIGVERDHRSSFRAPGALVGSSEPVVAPARILVAGPAGVGFQRKAAETRASTERIGFT